MAESFVKTIKLDYVAHMPKPDRETALRNLAIAFEHYNEQHPHSALNHRSPREFRRLPSAILRSRGRITILTQVRDSLGLKPGDRVHFFEISDGQFAMVAAIHSVQSLNGSATAKALDYSLKRWVALTRYLDDGAVPIDNNRVENQIRPWAIGRSNWLFAGSLRSG
jgi:AbrB family looped-hinge helix DNA binding protein